MKIEDILNVTHSAQSEAKLVKIKYLWFIFNCTVTVDPTTVITDINKDFIIAGKDPKMIKLKNLRKIYIV